MGSEKSSARLLVPPIIALPLIFGLGILAVAFISNFKSNSSSDEKIFIAKPLSGLPQISAFLTNHSPANRHKNSFKSKENSQKSICEVHLSINIINMEH